jgi:hypothetical protein
MKPVPTFFADRRVDLRALVAVFSAVTDPLNQLRRQCRRGRSCINDEPSLRRPTGTTDDLGFDEDQLSTTNEGA